VRRVGVRTWSRGSSTSRARAAARYFPFFGALVVGVTLLLYRSVRTLLAFVLSLASAVALGVAAGGLLGFTFTIISSLVPLTVLVTTLASLVYLHSRFVDRPADVPVREHQLKALRSKLLPVTASTFAAVLGFARCPSPGCGRSGRWGSGPRWVSPSPGWWPSRFFQRCR